MLPRAPIADTCGQHYALAMLNVRVTWTTLLWIPASALFAIGWYLDGNGWTTEHGFASNILAAITSGLFGLPIAAIVVQWLLRQDAESRRRREIVGSARRNFAEMQSSLDASGIKKVQRLKDPVTAASFDIVGLNFAASYSGGVAQGQMINQVRSSFSTLTPAISENLPNLAEDEWRFLSVLRRWDVLRDTVFSAGEVGDLRIISDESYAAISTSIETVASERVEWLPNIMRDADILVAALGGPHDEGQNIQIEPQVRVMISDLNDTLSRLSKQLSARVDLYTGITEARKVAVA
jgi:hypothetical protein